MTFEPTSLDLDALFVDPRMFDSRDSFRAAGFQVLDPAKDSEVMVAAHPAAPGCLFKKYGGDTSLKKQRKNYEARIEGARRLGHFVAERQLRRVIAPRKHLHELPARFRSEDRAAHVLVVERLDLLSGDESLARYRDVDDATLRELITVIARFPGLDSNNKNVRFARDGRVAFVDLENWDRRKKSRLKHIGDYLTSERRELAHEILDDLT